MLPGTGKTTMIRELMGLDLEVGNRFLLVSFCLYANLIKKFKIHRYLIPTGTTQYQVCPAVIDGEQYLFVDTPSFGAHDLDDMDIFNDIMSCFKAIGPFGTFAGILYVYGLPGDRMLASVSWETGRFAEQKRGEQKRDESSQIILMLSHKMTRSREVFCC